jgi:Tfp pilus assembly protein PilF
MHLFSRVRVVSSVASLALVAAALQGAPAFAADTMPEPASQSTKNTSNKERITVAREAIKAKDFKKSIAELTLAVQEHPGNAELHNLLGYSYRKQATPDLPRAFEQYRLALKFDSEHRGANEYIGEAYLMDKKPAKAEEHLAKLKSICGNTTCEEYQDLAKSIADYKAKNK